MPRHALPFAFVLALVSCRGAEMKQLKRSFLLLMALVGGCTSIAPGKAVFQPTGTAFIDVAVVPMDEERLLEHQTVLVRGDKIELVGAAAATRIPRGYRRVDGRGKYLMPGLTDFHVHIRSPAEFGSYLVYGVTTIAQLSGAYSTAPDILGYRALTASGALTGPSIYASGPLVDDAPLLPHTRDIGVGISTPDEARAVVSAQKAAGYDMVKIYQMLRPEVYDALTAEATRQGIAAVGHVPQTIELERALGSGQAMIAHGSFFLEPLLNSDASAYDLTKLRPLVEMAVRNRVAVMPTIMTVVGRQRLTDDAAHQAVFEDPEVRYQAPSLVEAWRRTTPSVLRRYGRPSALTVPFHLHLVKALQEAGVLILLGTDEGAVPGLFPGRSVHEEIATFVEAGLTPYQALATATRNPGKFVRLRIDPDERFGVIAPGQRADLLLLESNPLTDVAGAAKPVGVMTRGRWFTDDALQGLRKAALEPGPAPAANDTGRR